MAIHQEVEHAGSRRLSDGCRNSRDGRLRMDFDIHTFIIDESFMSINRHTAR
jgi:hypothetical protein